MYVIIIKDHVILFNKDQRKLRRSDHQKYNFLNLFFIMLYMRT